MKEALWTLLNSIGKELFMSLSEEFYPLSFFPWLFKPQHQDIMVGDLGVKDCCRVADTDVLPLLFSGSVVSDSL